MTTTEIFVEKAAQGLRRAGIDPKSRGRIGVALSGGADSVALLGAMRELGRECVALHCNFHLRQEESDRDERFARQVAEALGAGMEVAQLRTLEYARSRGISVEMAARDLRYEFFAQCAKRLKLDFVAVGHHRDDNVETLWLNLLRGTGLTGAAGIRPLRTDRPTATVYVRPLLEVSKQEILDYLAAKGLDYVTDSSNLENDVRRNRLRNVVLPAVEREFADAPARFAASLRCLDADRELLEDLMAQKAEKYVTREGEILIREIIRQEKRPATVLFHLLQSTVGGFAYETVEKILAASQSGLVFEGSRGRRVLLDRDRLKPLQTPAASANAFEQELTLRLTGANLPLSHGGTITVEKVPICDFKPNKDGNTLWLSEKTWDCQIFTLRRPRRGDRIRPFGMKGGSKLLNDLYTEARIPLDQKPLQWVMAAADSRIVWAVGLRPSSHFSIDPERDKFAVRLVYRP